MNPDPDNLGLPFSTAAPADSAPPAPSPGSRAYTIRAIRYQAVRERTLKGPRQILRPSDAADCFRAYLGEPDREHFAVIALNQHKRPTAIHLVSMGGLNSAPVHPREVYAFAIDQHAGAIIVCHNHPSGDTQPSQDDVRLTEHLRAAGRLLGIELLDHVILGDPAGNPPWVSLREGRVGFP